MNNTAYRYLTQDLIELGFRVTLHFEFERILGWRTAWSNAYTARLDERPVS